MGRFDIPEELKESPTRIRVAGVLDNIVQRANDRQVTPGTAKNYFQFCELVSDAMVDYQERLNSTTKVDLSWEEPDREEITEIITVGLVKRMPGQFDQGAPFEGSVKNLRPIIRESKIDPEAPGYRKVILGKWFDNLVRFTCWAQTNKEAIARSFWFEEFIEKYTWFFTASGVARVIFWEQQEDQVIDNKGKKLYGRPLLFYVKTEELTSFSEKELEEIYINLVMKKQV